MDSQNSSKGEHYNLRWNNYTANLIQVFSEHQHHQTLVDVTLSCEGQFVKAHKLILSACSIFFEDMFKIHSSVPHPFIILNGIKFNHLKHVLEFIYHGEVKILDEDLEGVLALGESFQIKGLSSVKLKHQIPSSDQQTSSPAGHKASPNPINIIHSATPNIKTQQKENIQEQPSTQEKLREQLTRTIRRVQQLDKNRIENSRLGVQNGKDTNEPVSKKTRTAEVTPITSSNTQSRIDPVPKKNVENSGDFPKSTNAFMIFANEWRKKLAVEHPDENNKGISVRLSNMWKSLSAETKESYYLAARKAQLEHDLKHPSSNLLGTKKRKAVRRKTIDCASQMDFVDMREREHDDDIEIIEIAEDPIDISGTVKTSTS